MGAGGHHSACRLPLKQQVSDQSATRRGRPASAPARPGRPPPLANGRDLPSWQLPQTLQTLQLLQTLQKTPAPAPAPAPAQRAASRAVAAPAATARRPRRRWRWRAAQTPGIRARTGAAPRHARTISMTSSVHHLPRRRAPQGQGSTHSRAASMLDSRACVRSYSRIRRRQEPCCTCSAVAFSPPPASRVPQWARPRRWVLTTGRRRAAR